jgi:hypothetical protein
LKHLKSLYTFVLAGFEQQFIPALALALAVGRKVCALNETPTLKAGESML